MDDERRRSSVLQIQGDEQDEQNEAEQKMASKTNGAMSVEDDNDVISMIFIEFCGISESFRKFARFSWVVRPERPKQPEHTHTHTHTEFANWLQFDQNRFHVKKRKKWVYGFVF